MICIILVVLTIIIFIKHANAFSINIFFLEFKKNIYIFVNFFHIENVENKLHIFVCKHVKNNRRETKKIIFKINLFFNSKGTFLYTIVYISKVFRAHRFGF